MLFHLEDAEIHGAVWLRESVSELPLTIGEMVGPCQGLDFGPDLLVPWFCLALERTAR